MRFLALLPFLLPAALHAEEPTCKPAYEVKFDSCVTAESPTVVKNVKTDWLLVNEGAVRISDGICTDHIAVIAQKHPQASNIKFADIDDRAAPWRGLNKRDVYCKFTFDEPQKEKVESQECGIRGINRQCTEKFSVQDVKDCLNAP